MMSREQIALLWSVEDLHSVTGKLYLWRFSWDRAYNEWIYPRLWKDFTDDLRHVVPLGTMGIRVAERFPGNNVYGVSHGLHFHCLFSHRFDMRNVWRVCRKHGMGCNGVKVKDTKAVAMYIAKYLTDTGKHQVRMRRVGAMWGFGMTPKNALTMDCDCKDSVTYLTRLWGRGQYGPEQISSIYSSPNGLGDYRTLLVGLDYKHNRRMQSFTWSESRCKAELSNEPYCHWVTETDTIYEPGRMPVLLKPQPY